jgi:hypothetical protein
MNNSRINPPDLAELLSRRKGDLKTEINCIMLGTIEKFNPSEQTADITINFLRNIRGEETDSQQTYPIIVRCPVVILSGGEGNITFPIEKGDTCIVLFCDRDIDGWFMTGQVSIPNSARTHDLNDGIALVGIRSLKNILQGVNPNGPQMSMGYNYISVADKIQVLVKNLVGIIYVTTTLRQGLDALCQALLTSQDTDSNTFDAASKAKITAAQELIDIVLESYSSSSSSRSSSSSSEG